MAGHIIACIDGVILDTWDCSIVQFIQHGKLWINKEIRLFYLQTIRKDI
jgi:hypothetical protein